MCIKFKYIQQPTLVKEKYVNYRSNFGQILKGLVIIFHNIKQTSLFIYKSITFLHSNLIKQKKQKWGKVIK